MANFFESIFEFLFKYRPITWTRADFTFGSPYPMLMIVVLALIAAGLAFMTYQRVGARSTPKDRIVLTGLRLGIVLILMVCLMRPMLVLSTALPQRNFVGILLDNSQSMSIADEGKERRCDVALKHFANENSKVVDELKEKFLLRYYEFSNASTRTGEPTEIKCEGGQTKVMDALDKAEQDLSAVPVAGMLLISDGADNSESAAAEQILKFKARGIPIYTVGVGQEKFKKDVEISRVEAPPSALKGASVIVDLMITQRGFSGAKKTLTVEDQGRIVSTQEITLPPDGEVAPVRVHVTAADGGPRQFQFKIASDGNELIAENNLQEAMVIVNDRREKILYFEGEPRWEAKFVRRALENDENLQLVLLQRTAENKYWRAGLDNGEELAGGFPTTREELFKYRSIILGSVEASFFTNDQLQMLADFVGDRGGGLLMLGGRQSFSEGGYYGTPLQDVQPLVFGQHRGNANDSEDDQRFAELSVSLTPAGMIHPVTRLASDEKESAVKWSKLPAVTTVNQIDDIKPGATELISGKILRGRGGQPVLVHQRYGRGKVIAMPVQDSWMWQMHADIPVEDETHETLWKQLARWLVTGVPRQVNVTTERDRVAPNEGVVIKTEVSDKNFIHLNNARVKAWVSGPGLTETEVPMEWTVDHDGEYRASFTPKEQGQYRIRSQAWQGDSLLGVDTTFVVSAPMRSEYFGAQMNKPLLTRIAEETGGKFYTPDKLDGLAEDMTYTKSGAVAVQQLDLWDMPLLFMGLIALVGSEWVYRKLRGLA